MYEKLAARSVEQQIAYLSGVMEQMGRRVEVVERRAGLRASSPVTALSDTQSHANSTRRQSVVSSGSPVIFLLVNLPFWLVTMLLLWWN